MKFSSKIRHDSTLLLLWVVFAAFTSFSVVFGYWDSLYDTDEECGQGSFTCLSGECVVQDMVCDGIEDCLGGEDELDCNHTCLPYEEFQCDDGECISHELKCDGAEDCLDSSDEDYCGDTTHVTCKDGYVPCQDGQDCIPINNVCDGEMDCDDDSDEKHCVDFTCGSGQFRCGNTTVCLPVDWRCDGSKDCEDGSDETCSEEVLHCKSFVCKDKSACLDIGAVCNGTAECLDGSDEVDDCHGACQRLGCEHDCFPLGDEAFCRCKKGFASPPNDKKACHDIDECSVKRHGKEPACSQICRNTIGSFTCRCVPPYILVPNNHTCRVPGPAPILLFSTKTEIRKFNLHNRVYDLIHKDLYAVDDLEVDAMNRRLFWIDSTLKKIYTSPLTDNRFAMVDVGLVSPSGLSYNWNSRLLYVVDSKEGIIVACKVDDISCTIVISGLKDRQPEDIIVEPIGKHIYWMETADPVRIMRSDLDGQHKEVFLNTHMFRPDHLLIDYPTLSLYWVDVMMGVIYRVPLRSPDVNRIKSMEVVVSHDVQHASALAIIEDTLIWAEKKTGSIMQANKFTGKNRRRILQHRGRVTGAMVLHPALQPSAGDNACWRVQCSHVCVESDNDEGFTCMCPPEMVLNVDHRVCVWSSSPFLLISSHSKILRVPYLTIGHLNVPTLLSDNLRHFDNMDTNPITEEIIFTILSQDGKPLVCKSTSIWDSKFNFTVIEDRADYLGEPRSLALDWAANQVFWLNTQKRAIEIFQVEGSAQSTLRFDHVEDMKSIAINVTQGLLYFSTWGDHPQIVQCKMDGTDCKTIVEQGVRQPDNLLSFDSRLFWSDVSIGGIFSVLYDGTDRSQHVRDGYPREFAVYGRLFFSDNASEAVHVFDYELNDHVTDYNFPDFDITDMTMIVPRAPEPNLPCMVNNGDCSDICLSLPDQQQRCLCPVGKALDTHQRTCHASGEKCSADEVYCLSSLTCVLKKDLCSQRVSCQTPATSVNCYLDYDDAATDVVMESCPDENRCEQLCTLSPDGSPVCSCDQGFVLDLNQRTCSDVDECSVRNGNCSQLCRNNRGSYKCSCVSGYFLIGDKATCYSRDHEDAYLMVSTARGLYRVSMDGESEKPFIIDSNLPLTFDVTPRAYLDTLDWTELVLGEDKVYVAESVAGKKNSTRIYDLERGSKGNRQKVVDAKVTLLRADHVTGNIYYISHDGALCQMTVCDKHLHECQTLISSDDWIPAGLVFHQGKRMMYWNDLVKKTIHGAHMDGREVRRVVSDVASVVNGLTLDTIRERFYWIDYSRASMASIIQSVRLDGTDRYTIETFPRKLFSSIDIFSGFLYLTEKNGNKVQKISSFAARPVLTVMCKMGNPVQDLRVVHTAEDVSNPCANKSCPYLCILGKSGARCACPDRLNLNVLSNCDGHDSQIPVRPILPSSRAAAPDATSTPTLPSQSKNWNNNRPYPPASPLPSPEDESPKPVRRSCRGYCLNEGFCRLVSRWPKCTCAEGFTGTRCNSTVSVPWYDDATGVTVNSSSVNMTLTSDESNGMSGGTVAGLVIVIVIILVAGIIGFRYRKRCSTRNGIFKGAEVKMDSDQASLVTASGYSDEFYYCKWDLDGNLLDSSDTSNDSAVYCNSNSPGPIFSPLRHSSSSS